MLSCRLGHLFAICATGFLLLILVSAVHEESADEAISKCDGLASDPLDPGRYAAGVTKQQFAPGAAIEVCKAAVEANPDLARSWFQLGRSYWIGERDSDAFSAFVQAAKRGYAPAMKYIGDAYNEGRGLPPGEQQSPDTALKWYKKAKATGLREADKAIQELRTTIADNTFDASLFQNPGYMAILYKGNFGTIDNPITFFSYSSAFTQELGGTNVFFIDQDCKGMVTMLGGMANGMGVVLGYVQELQGENAVANTITSAILAKFAENQGERDADILMNRYKCSSPITLRIVNNVQEIPALIKGIKIKGINETPVSVPLNQQKIYRLYWGAIAGDCNWKDSPACQRVQQLVASKKYDIIDCSYGPSNSDGTGFSLYEFWHNNVPDNPSSYAVPGDQHPFSMLGKRAVATCPATEREAKPIFQASRLSQ